MTDNNKSLLPSLGVAIEDNFLRAVEIAQGESQPLLLAVQEVDASDNLWEGFGTDPGAIDRLLSYLTPVVDGLPAKPSSLAFALDRRWAVIKSHIIDSELPVEEKEEFVNWEARKRLSDSADEYFIDIYRLKSSRPGFDLFLSVSVKNEVIDIFQEIGSNFGIPVSLLDVDLFAGIDAVLFTMETEPVGKICIIRYADAEYSLTLVEDRDFSCSVTFKQSVESGLIVLDRTSDDKLVGSVVESLSRADGADPFADIDNYILYGSRVDVPLFTRLVQQNEAKVTFLDPFSNMEKGEAIIDSVVSENPGRFIVATGLALRPLASEDQV